jgi:hypothetical protein
VISPRSLDVNRVFFSDRPIIVRLAQGKAFTMSKRDRTHAALAATEDRLKREMSELRQRRQVVAEAERANGDREERRDLRGYLEIF